MKMVSPSDGWIEITAQLSFGKTRDVSGLIIQALTMTG
jgi:hypothetical protein